MAHSNTETVYPRVHDSDDERSKHRHKVCKLGIIEFGGQHDDQPCIVRDMNVHGAKIELQNSIALPKEFMLNIEVDGVQIDCGLIWQKPPCAGVVFIGESRPVRMTPKQMDQLSEAVLSPQFMEEFKRQQAAEHRGQPAESSYSSMIAKTRRRAIKPKPFGKRTFTGNP